MKALKSLNSFVVLLGLFVTIAACGTGKKDASGECSDADCARAVTTAEPDPMPKAEPGAITIKCGVFKEGAEVASPCESVLVRVFAPNSAKPKTELTLSGAELVIPNMSDKEKVNLNLTLKGCAKPNLLPSLKGGESRETYFKTPCK